MLKICQATSEGFKATQGDTFWENVVLLTLTSQQTIGDHHDRDAFAKRGQHKGRACNQRARNAHRSTPVLVA